MSHSDRSPNMSKITLKQLIDNTFYKVADGYSHYECIGKTIDNKRATTKDRLKALHEWVIEQAENEYIENEGNLEKYDKSIVLPPFKEPPYNPLVIVKLATQYIKMSHGELSSETWASFDYLLEE